MRALSSKHKMVLLFASLGMAVLFCFQNCSQGLYQLATSTEVEAKSSKSKTDFDDLLQQSERELDHTQKVMKSRNELNVAAPEVGRYGSNGAITTKSKDMKIKLVRKPARKQKNYAQNKKSAAGKNKKISLNQKSSKGNKSKRAITLAKPNKKSKLAKNEKVSGKALTKKAPQRTPAKVSSKKLKADAKSLKKKKKKKKVVSDEE